MHEGAHWPEAAAGDLAAEADHLDEMREHPDGVEDVLLGREEVRLRVLVLGSPLPKFSVPFLVCRLVKDCNLSREVVSEASL